MLTNKTSLFELISDYLICNMIVPEGSIFITTIGNVAICKQSTVDTSDLTPSTHEEADVRIILHLGHTVSDGHTDIFTRTNDTDVVALAVAAPVIEHIIGFGVGNKKHKQMRYIQTSEIIEMIDKSRALALPGFHAFTGSDTTASFFNKGKKKA